MKDSTTDDDDLPRWPYFWHERLLFAVLYVISWTLLRLPRRAQLALGNGFGNFVYLIAGKRRDVVRGNLKIAFPEQTDDERERLSRAHFKHLGNMLLEYFWMPAMTRRDFERLFVFEGREHYDRALAGGKGAMVLGSHMGSGDVGIVACQLAGYPMHLIGRRTRQRWSTRMLFGVREIHGVTALPEENVMRKVFRALKANQIVIFVLDQFQGPPSGIKSKFFGFETGTAFGLALFAEKSGAPIVPVWTYRADDGRVHIVIEPELPMERGETREDTYRIMTQRFNDEIERVVRLKPAQWFWVHKRFKVHKH